MNDLLDVSHRDRIHTGKRFIEQDELRCGGQGSGDFHATTFATGEAHAEVVTDMVDVEFLQQAFQLLATSGLVEFLAGLKNGHDVIGNRQLAEDRCFLRQIADAGPCAAVHRLVADVQVVDQYATLIGLDQPDDHVETGGLAGAVRAEQADDLAAVDGQTDVTHDLAALVALGQMLSFQSCHYWAFCSSVFFFGWITMSTRGRCWVTLLPVARPALATCLTVS